MLDCDFEIAHIEKCCMWSKLSHNPHLINSHLSIIECIDLKHTLFLTLSDNEESSINVSSPWSSTQIVYFEIVDQIISEITSYESLPCMIHFRLTHYISQVRDICCCDKSCWWNIKQFYYKWRCHLSLMIRQFTSHCDRINPCSYWIFCVDLEFRVEPVEIYYKWGKLGDRRDWVTLVPVPENIIAHYWWEKEVRIVIGLFWVVNYIAMINHWIGYYCLIAA